MLVLAWFKLYSLGILLILVAELICFYRLSIFEGLPSQKLVHGWDS